jgi:hypothetical protein
MATTYKIPSNKDIFQAAFTNKTKKALIGERDLLSLNLDQLR